MSLGPWFSLEAPLGIPIPPFPLYFPVLLTWKGDEALLLEVNFKICGVRLLAFTQPPKTLTGSAPPAAVPRSPSRWHCDPDHPRAPVLGLGTQTLVRPGEAPRGRTSPPTSPTGRVLFQREGSCFCFTLSQDHFKEGLWFSEGSASWSRVWEGVAEGGE